MDARDARVQGLVAYTDELDEAVAAGYVPFFVESRSVGLPVIWVYKP